jgi:hypothetical protein
MCPLMSADLAVEMPASAGRWPGTVISGLTARKAARSAVVWGLVFGLYVASSALGYAATYKTPQARAQLAATFGENFGFNALIGPAHQIGTIAGFTAWRALGVLSIVGSVWGCWPGPGCFAGKRMQGAGSRCWPTRPLGAGRRRRPWLGWPPGCWPCGR